MNPTVATAAAAVENTRPKSAAAPFREYPAQEPDRALVDFLYARAVRLEKDWANARLADDFGSRMVAAALRRLDSLGLDLAPRDADKRQALRREAENALQLCWSTSARRDYAREREAVATGRKPALCPISALGEDEAWHPRASLYAAAGDGLLDSETAQDALDALIHEAGMTRLRALAVVLRAMDRTCDDIAAILSAIEGEEVSLAYLRKWLPAHLPEALAALNRVFTDDGEGGSSGDTPGSDSLQSIGRKNQFGVCRNMPAVVA